MTDPVGRALGRAGQQCLDLFDQVSASGPRPGVEELAVADVGESIPAVEAPVEIVRTTCNPRTRCGLDSVGQARMDFSHPTAAHARYESQRDLACLQLDGLRLLQMAACPSGKPRKTAVTQQEKHYPPQYRSRWMICALDRRANSLGPSAQ